MSDTIERLTAIFENIKKSPDDLLKFLRSMPKSADLHHHLDGSCYFEDILEFAIAEDLRFDPIYRRFFRSMNGLQGVPASELLRHSEHRRAFESAFSASGWRPGSGNGKDAFFGVFGALAGLGYGEGRMLGKLLLRSCSENILYQEIIAPVVPPELIDDLQGHLPEDWRNDLGGTVRRLAKALSTHSFADQIAARLDGWEREAGMTEGNSDPTIFRYLGYALRNETSERFLVSTAAVFAATKIDARVVGYSMAGGEDLAVSMQDFDTHLTILDELNEHFGPVPAALHAGELTPSDCNQEILRNRIKRSVENGRARRIGHGVSIKWESTPDLTMGLLREAGVAVEICLTSNHIILEIKPSDSPLREYLSAEVPVIICTDDDGISRSSLSHEFQKAIIAMDLNYRDVRTLMRQGLVHSFLPAPEKTRLLQSYDMALADFELKALQISQ